MSSPTPTTEDTADRTPLSYTQEFLCGFDRGDAGGPFGPRYHNSRGLRLTGELDIEALRQALADLVVRHETLRTVLVRSGAQPYQQVVPPRSPELVLHELPGDPGTDRDRRAEEFLNEVEEGMIDADQPPLLRAHLGRFDDRDAVLVLVAHHVATDGWSMRLLVRDLAGHYGLRTGEQVPLPEVRSYREFTMTQRAPESAARMADSRSYWREKLRDARMLGVPTDRTRSTGLEKVTSTYRFAIEPELSAATLRLAGATRSSAFMVLLAAHCVLLYRITGATDIVVPTITAGRADTRFEDTVGPFFNFVPLRVDLSGCATFRDVVHRARATCIEAQTHEIPFAYIVAEAPELMSTFAADDLAVGAFQVFQHPFGGAGEMNRRLAYREIRRRLLFQPVSSTIPDGVLWTLDLDTSDGSFGAVKFNRTEFDQRTLAGHADGFQHALRAVVATPGSPLG